MNLVETYFRKKLGLDKPCRHCGAPRVLAGNGKLPFGEVTIRCGCLNQERTVLVSEFPIYPYEHLASELLRVETAFQNREDLMAKEPKRVAVRRSMHPSLSDCDDLLDTLTAYVRAVVSDQRARQWSTKETKRKHLELVTAAEGKLFAALYRFGGFA